LLVATVVIAAIIVSATILATSIFHAPVTTTSTEYAISTTATASIPGLPSLSSIENSSVSLSNRYSIEVDANNSRIYLPGVAGDNLTVLEATTGVAVTTIKLPGSPRAVAIDTRTDMLYVNVQECSELPNASNPCGSLTVPSEIVEVNGSSNVVVGEIPIQIDGLAVDSDTGTLFGTHACPHPLPQVVPAPAYPCGYLYAIDAQSGSLVANVSMGAALGDINVDLLTDTVYIQAYGPASDSYPLGTQELFIVNGTSDAVQSRIPLNFMNGVNVADDPSTNVVYVLAENGTNADLLALNGTSGRMIYSSVVGSDCSVSPDELVINTYTDQVYLYAETYTQGIRDFFVAVNGATGSVVSMFSINGSPVQTAIDSQNGAVYVLLTGSLLILGGVPTSGGYVNASLLTDTSCVPPTPV